MTRFRALPYAKALMTVVKDETPEHRETVAEELDRHQGLGIRQCSKAGHASSLPSRPRIASRLRSNTRWRSSSVISRSRRSRAS